MILETINALVSYYKFICQGTQINHLHGTVILLTDFYFQHWSYFHLLKNLVNISSLNVVQCPHITVTFHLFLSSHKV